MKISAIVTTFNRATIVPDAVRSILAQSTPVDEIILVDDGSTDETADSVRIAFAGAAVSCRYIKKLNGGMASALNHGVSQASFDWIAFLDDDDLWDMHHIQRMHELHRRHPTLGCISGLRIEGNSLQAPPPALLSGYERDTATPDLLIFRQRPFSKPLFTPVVGTTIVERKLVQRVPFSPEAGARVDIHFFWRLSEVTDIGLDLQCHGTGRQFRVSLLSTDEDAPAEVKEKIVLKRNADEIAMLEDLLRGRDGPASLTLQQLLKDTLIGRSYLLRGYGRHREALQHLQQCFGRCDTVPTVKEGLLALLRVSPKNNAS